MSNSQRNAGKAAEWTKRVIRAYEAASKVRASLDAAEEVSKRASEIYRVLEAISKAKARLSLETAEEALKRHELSRSVEAASKAGAPLEAAEEASKRASEIYRALEAASKAKAGLSLETAEEASERHELSRMVEAASKARASLEAVEEASKRASEIYRALEAASKADARPSLEPASRQLAPFQEAAMLASEASDRAESKTFRILEWLQQYSAFREMVHGASLAFDFEPVHRYRTFKRSDFEALLCDWQAVGDDLRRAMREFDDRAQRAEESEEQGHSNRQAFGREGRERARTS